MPSVIGATCCKIPDGTIRPRHRGRDHRITPWRLRAGDTPDWSPDGKTVLFHSNQNGPPEISGNLCTVRASGDHAKKLTFATARVRQ